MSDDDSLLASVSVIAARIVELNKLGTPSSAGMGRRWG
jgi:hypothetical protein